MQLGTQEQGKGMCPPAGRGAGPHPGSQSWPVLPLSEEIASVWLLEPVPSLGRAGCCRSAMGCVGFGTGSSPRLQALAQLGDAFDFSEKRGGMSLP